MKQKLRVLIQFASILGQLNDNREWRRRNKLYIKVCIFFTLFLVSPILRSAETLSMGVFENHYQYVEASDSYGIAWQIMSLASQRAGIELQLEEQVWTRSVNRLKAKRLESVFATVYSEQREQWATFSTPLVLDYTSVFTRNDNPIKSIELIDKENSVIGVNKDSIEESYAKTLGFQSIYMTAKRDLLYKMINAGRIDYLINAQAIMDYYCLNAKLPDSSSCLKKVGPPLGNNQIHFITLKGDKANEAKVQKINQQISAMINSGEILDIYKQRGLNKPDYDKWLAWVKRRPK